MTIRVAPEYVQGVRKYFGRNPGSASKHPARPPYVRRQPFESTGDDPNWPSPGQRATWWMTFDQAQLPFHTSDYIATLVTDTGGLEEWAIAWGVDGGTPDLGGAGPFDGQVDVAILSTDTAAQVRDKTIAAIEARKSAGSPHFPSGVTLTARTVVAGDGWARRGVIPGAALFVEDSQLGPFATPCAMIVGIFADGGEPPVLREWPAVPVRWNITQGSPIECMIYRGQEAVYCLPARFGLNFALLPIGDEVPSSIFGDVGQPDWTMDPLPPG